MKERKVHTQVSSSSGHYGAASKYLWIILLVLPMSSALTSSLDIFVRVVACLAPGRGTRLFKIRSCTGRCGQR